MLTAHCSPGGADARRRCHDWSARLQPHASHPTVASWLASLREAATTATPPAKAPSKTSARPADPKVQAALAADVSEGVIQPVIEVDDTDGPTAPVFVLQRRDFALVRNKWMLCDRAGSKERTIVDLRDSNATFASEPHMQYETVEEFLDGVSPRSWIALADISSAYHAVPLSLASRRLCRMRGADCDYESLVLAFGCSVAPFYFSFFTAVLISAWRATVAKLGLSATAMQLLDDTAIAAKTEAAAMAGLLLLIALARRMGFKMQMQKIRPPA